MNERMAKMRRYRDMIGGLRASLLLGASTAALLTGCDMFDGNTPVSSRQVRPGAERSVAVSNSLPAAGTGRQYDTGITAVDETRGGTQIGSIVAGKGGQKAQQEEQAKAQRDTDRKARGETERQIAQRKAEDALAAGAPPPPAPVTTTAIAPPTETAAATPSTPSAQIATPPAPEPMVVATAPVRPTDPNKAFEPPPGWVPPGQTAPMATASTAPATAIATAPPPATIAAPPPAATATTSTTLLPPPTETAAAAPQPAPVVVAATTAPARRVDPNKAFEPPPGWAPPGQAAPVATAAAPPPPAMASAPAPSGSTTMTTATTLLPPAQVASAAPPSITQPPAYEPTPMTQVRSATPRVGAGESAMPSSPADRPGFARPGDVAVAAAAPPPVTVTPIPEPAASPAVTVTATPTAPPVNLQADIAHAQSGAVPASAIKFPPGGPLQVGVIQFGRASSGLGGRDGDILKKIAQIQKKNGGTVRVVAHSEQDVTGSSVGQIEQGNYDVSRRRAINIANQLMALGVPRSAIVAEAASDSEPKYATNTARGIAANRRAEIFLDL